ncbi:hypothetical protein HZB02_06310 [Candidatus Woesearchaeota archaeon]|nr:hypothetical protein [Candidatus Woesearchaeota archaeon]
MVQREKRSPRLWLKGGIIGVVVCVCLFIFYAYGYFPLLQSIYGSEPQPGWTLIPPIVTGHIFPLFSGFIVPYGFGCPFTETACMEWSFGYCLKQEMFPTEACADRSEMIGFFSLVIILLAVYFGIGALIGWLIGRSEFVIPHFSWYCFTTSFNRSFESI